jgi:hypothetical protein
MHHWQKNVQGNEIPTKKNIHSFHFDGRGKFPRGPMAFSSAMFTLHIANFSYCFNLSVGGNEVFTSDKLLHP